MIEEFASAKINLTLEVFGRLPNGYHVLKSLVGFAVDAGDRLTLEPGPNLALETRGAEAAAIDGTNLITTVAEAVLRAAPGLTAGTFRLEKRLPIASGIGGGSADAAAAIRAIARASNIADPEAAFSAIAAGIGADIPVCIGGNGRQAAFMSGIGDNVWRPPSGTLLPPGGLAAVLVNPRVPVSTGAVFKALAAPASTVETEIEPPAPFATPDQCLAYIAESRNDLEEPAIGAVPVIADVLAALRGLPGCRLARMSGSGATCCALFDGMEEAQRAQMSCAARRHTGGSRQRG